MLNTITEWFKAKLGEPTSQLAVSGFAMVLGAFIEGKISPSNLGLAGIGAFLLFILRQAPSQVMIASVADAMSNIATAISTRKLDAAMAQHLFGDGRTLLSELVKLASAPPVLAVATPLQTPPGLAPAVAPLAPSVPASAPEGDALSALTKGTVAALLGCFMLFGLSACGGNPTTQGVLNTVSAGVFVLEGAADNYKALPTTSPDVVAKINVAEADAAKALAAMNTVSTVDPKSAKSLLAALQGIEGAIPPGLVPAKDQAYLDLAISVLGTYAALQETDARRASTTLAFLSAPGDVFLAY